MLFPKALSALSASASYLARLVLNKCTLGLFLIFTSIMLCHDFHFNLVFLAIAITGAALIVRGFVTLLHRPKTILPCFAANISRLPFRKFDWLDRKSRMVIGAAIAFGASLAYFFCGFGWDIFATWIIGIAVCAQVLYEHRQVRAQPITRRDAVSIISLYLVSLPLYLWSVYTVPFHLNSDESVIVAVEKDYIGHGIIDVFGLSGYFGFMYFPFLLQGWAAHLLGGIDLYHVRLLHAFAGTFIVPCAYIFFRVIGLRWSLAIAATLFVAFNHTLIDINRIASRINGGLLLELIALIALYEGIKNKCPFTTYLGGVLTGICFYAYYSARFTLPVWLLFLVLLFCFKQNTYSRKELGRLSSIFLFSFILSIAPLIAAQFRQPSRAENAYDYQKKSCLLYPQGRLLATDRWGKDGVIHCIVNGLTVFNNTNIDEAYIYPNPGHGFVDPLSGVLIWIGFIWVLATGHRELSALFAISGFLLEFLIFSLITFPSPNYGRLLVLLPFTGYFVAHGIDAIASIVGRLTQMATTAFTPLVKRTVFVCLILSTVALNTIIFYDYAGHSAVHGDEIGGTIRYVEERKNQPDHLFVVVASPDYRYFSEYSVGNCYGHISTFTSPQQDNKVFAPEDLTAIQIMPPFSIFMTKDLWKLKQDQLKKMYPTLIVHKITNERIAVENPAIVEETNGVHQKYRQWNDYVRRMDDALNAEQFEEVERLGQDYLNSPESGINGSYFKSVVLRALGQAYVRAHRFEKAEPVLLQALSIRKKLNSASSTDKADLADDLGELNAERLNWHASERWYKTAIACRESALSEERDNWIPGLAKDYKCLGTALWKQGQFVEAEKIFEHASELCRTNMGEGYHKEQILAQLAACKNEHHKAAPAHNP